MEFLVVLCLVSTIVAYPVAENDPVAVYDPNFNEPQKEIKDPEKWTESSSLKPFEVSEPPKEFSSTKIPFFDPANSHVKEFEWPKDEVVFDKDHEDKGGYEPVLVTLEYEKPSTLFSLLSSFTHLFDKVLAFLNPKTKYEPV